MTESLLEIRGLSKCFGKVRAVDELSFSMRSGEIHGFIGPNGSGKTTTMRMLATLELPDHGDAFVLGESILIEPRSARRHIGFMPDAFTPYAGLDVIQYLDFFARAYGLRGKERLRTLGSVVGFCGLEGFADRPVTGLSKGMGQRLHLAKTLLHDPRPLILDEPAAGLDPRARIEFRELLKELATHGKGILISSHILTELKQIVDGITILEQGRLIESGSVQEIRKVGHERHRMRMRTLGEAELAERFLLTQPGVLELTIGSDGLHFDFEGDEAEMAQLLEWGIGQGLRIVEFHMIEADLEEIFLRKTEGRLQ